MPGECSRASQSEQSSWRLESRPGVGCCKNKAEKVVPAEVKVALSSAFCSKEEERFILNGFNTCETVKPTVESEEILSCIMPGAERCRQNEAIEFPL